MLRSLFRSQARTRPILAVFTAPAATPPQYLFSRPFSTSMLDQFRDRVPRAQRMAEPVGRPWSVAELRRKSFQDLHKLWFVLYKERNMLLTEKQLSRRKGVIFPQPERMKKVQKSMGAIRHVLGERKREKLASLALANMDDDVQGDVEA